MIFINLTGNIKKIEVDYETNKVLINLEVNEKKTALIGYEKIRDAEKLSISIDKYRKKRSKDANALYWKLINEISNELPMISQEEIHLSMLKKYGQRMLVPIKKDDNPLGYFKYFEYFNSTKINGKEADYYIVYKNSSDMNTHEFYLLLQGTIAEAKELDIETPDEYQFRLLMLDYEKERSK